MNHNKKKKVDSQGDTKNPPAACKGQVEAGDAVKTATHLIGPIDLVECLRAVAAQRQWNERIIILLIRMATHVHVLQLELLLGWRCAVKDVQIRLDHAIQCVHVHFHNKLKMQKINFIFHQVPEFALTSLNIALIPINTTSNAQ